MMVLIMMSIFFIWLSLTSIGFSLAISGKALQQSKFERTMNINEDAFRTAIVHDRSGDSLVLTISESHSSLLKLDARLDVLWQKEIEKKSEFATTSTEETSQHQVISDHDGNVYVSYATGAGANTKLNLNTYDSAGLLLSSHSLQNRCPLTLSNGALQLDRESNVYLLAKVCSANEDQGNHVQLIKGESEGVDFYARSQFQTDPASVRLMAVHPHGKVSLLTENRPTHAGGDLDLCLQTHDLDTTGTALSIICLPELNRGHTFSALFAGPTKPDTLFLLGVGSGESKPTVVLRWDVGQTDVEEVFATVLPVVTSFFDPHRQHLFLLLFDSTGKTGLDSQSRPESLEAFKPPEAITFGTGEWRPVRSFSVKQDMAEELVRSHSDPVSSISVQLEGERLLVTALKANISSEGGQRWTVLRFELPLDQSLIQREEEDEGRSVRRRTQTASCPTGWTAHGDSCYWLDNTSQVTRTQCAATCASLGASLPCVGSESENSFVDALTNNNVWLSISDPDQDGSFQWPDDCSSAFYNFDPAIELTGGTELNFAYLKSGGLWVAVGDVAVSVCACEMLPLEPLCPDGWTVFDDSCYRLDETHSNRDVCQSYCNSQSSNFPCVRSAEENEFLRSKVSFNQWIGYSRSAGGFDWYSGCPSTFENWQTGAPGSKIYVHLRADTGQWNDKDNSQNAACTCQSLTAEKPARGCPDGWTYFHDNCYYVDRLTSTFTDCRTKCSGMSSEMLCIMDSSEDAFVDTLIDNINKGVWIGLNDEVTPDTYVWDTSCTSTYTNWQSGQPNNVGGDQEYIAKQTDSTQWGDFDNAGTNGITFACACQTPTTVFYPPPTVVPSLKPTAVPTLTPSGKPSAIPTLVPTAVPTLLPSLTPSAKPTLNPTAAPSALPSIAPSQQPSAQPSSTPSGQPSSQPSTQPSLQPAVVPSSAPSVQPTSAPSTQPSTLPSSQPSAQPAADPSSQPSTQPSSSPSTQPSTLPSTQPSSQPTVQPSLQPFAPPTSLPSSQPSSSPSKQPSAQPSTLPSNQPTGQPTSLPSCQPSTSPSNQPTTKPTDQPSSQPSTVPTTQPTVQPTSLPTDQPSVAPTTQPSNQPSRLPSTQPTSNPTMQPSTQPITQPTTQPTSQPSTSPSSQPSSQPSMQPTAQPSKQPSTQPTSQPTVQPSAQPSAQPTTQPSAQPSAQPSGEPTSQPSAQPSSQPTNQPTCIPSLQPSTQPSSRPTSQPSSQPSAQPSTQPSLEPSNQPTAAPSAQPTEQPSSQPTTQPTTQPSSYPTNQPSGQPSGEPSIQPSNQPSGQPSIQPSTQPTGQPSRAPSVQPSVQPSSRPSGQPSTQPTDQPSAVPSSEPSRQPTTSPSVQPSEQPTSQPTTQPTTQPSAHPSSQPSTFPSRQPSGQPSVKPTSQPSALPSSQPSVSPSSQPSTQPTGQPLSAPTSSPTEQPSAQPSTLPSTQPSTQPTSDPSSQPSAQPSCTPSIQPSTQPTSFPTARPSTQPSKQPSSFPTGDPTGQPSDQPSHQPSAPPSLAPSSQPSALPTKQPTSTPSKQPSQQPSAFPTTVPSTAPTFEPSTTPSAQPSSIPSGDPTKQPAGDPSALPSCQPSGQPTTAPSIEPSVQPVSAPSGRPSAVPSTEPSRCPSSAPSAMPSSQPTGLPSLTPSAAPSVKSSIPLEPVTPRLTRARFAADGGSFTLSFDATTDRAGLRNSFTCGSLLSFAGAQYALCQWTSAAEITVSVAQDTSELSNIVEVGSVVTLLNTSNIRAFCSVPDEYCSMWNTVEAGSVLLEAPLTPTNPLLVVNAPRVVGGCEDFFLDLGASSGSGGRAWQSLTFSVAEQDDSSDAVKALERFLNQNYTVSPPTAVPNAILVRGQAYSMEVELCNFLGACSSESLSFLVLNSTTAVPSVSVPGTIQRTMTRRSELKLSARAFVTECSGSTRTSGLSYQWETLEVSPISGALISIAELSSVSRDPTRYTLPAFSLKADKNYVVRVRVQDPVSQANSSFAVSVAVQKAGVVAVLSGTRARSLRLGSSLEIDASSSYDEDKQAVTGLSAGLTFFWTCRQVLPNAGACPLSLLNSTGDVSGTNERLLVFAAEEAVNTSALIDLLVVGSDGRNDSLQVTVVTLPVSAPLITITTSSAAVDAVSTRRKLLISGSVDSPLSCTAQWQVDDPALDLREASLVPVTSTAAAGIVLLSNLYLASHTLQTRASYVFTLSCGESAAAISVTTNSAPFGGTFAVSPASGTELTTSFQFSAAQWSDTHLPLSFQFDFLSTGGDALVLRSRTEQSYASSTLPAGLDTFLYRVNCSLTVFDSLDATARSFRLVTVSPAAADVLGDLYSTQLSSITGGSVDNAKQTISVLSSVLNRVDCSAAPDCGSLHRGNCSSVSQTCGSCLEGYVGDAGHSNTGCVTVQEAMEGHKDKGCPDNCSSRGNCSFVSTNTGQVVPNCPLISEDCEAVCVCDAGFSGSLCVLSDTQLQGQQLLRSDLIAGLIGVVQNDELVGDSVESWVSGLSSLVRDRYDLSNSSAAMTRDLTQSILSGAGSLEAVSYEETLGLLGPIDAMADVSYEGAEVVALLSSFEALVSRDLISSQAAVSLSYKNFRVASVAMTSETVGSVVELAGSGAEESTGAIIAEDSVTGSVVKLSTIETAAKVFGNGSNQFQSNSLRVAVSGASTVVVTLKSNSPRYYEESYANWNFTSSCVGPEDFSVSNYTCPLSGVVLSHQCSGVAGRNTSYCPVPATTCNVLNLTTPNVGISPKGCVLLNYTADSTTCSCRVGGMGDGARRLQDAEEESGFSDLVSMATFLGSDFASTFSVAQDFSSPAAFERALIVILMFVVLWTGGLGLIFACAYRQQLMEKTVAEEHLKLQQRKRSIQQFGSQVSVFDTLSRYVEQVFPVVFGQKSYLHRMTEEIKKHHGYLTLITAPPGDTGNKTRVLTGCYLLTVQSLLMFLLGVFYDIQGPDDDGSCEPLRTEDSCLERKTIMDQDQTYCQWTENSTQAFPCTYRPPYITPLIALYIAILVSVVTAMLMYPIDRVFDLLSAPVADGDKVQATESLVGQVGKSASAVSKQVATAARRASTVAANVGAMMRERISHAGMLKVGMPTRDFPDATVSAHTLARASIKIIETRAQQNLANHRKTTVRMRQSVYIKAKSSRHVGLDQGIRRGRRRGDAGSQDSSEEESEIDSYGDSLSNSDSSDSYSDSSSESSGSDSDSEDSKEKQDYAEHKQGETMLAHRSILGANIPDLFLELQDEIHSQRRLLKPSELDAFDFAWGLDPTGEFVRDEKFMGGHLRVKAGAATNIFKELEHVKQETSRKVDKLSLATDVHTGLEILHLFVLDLLGRDTPAAQIFETKSAEDFKHTQVITHRTKVLAGLFVVLMNLFFAVYSVLKGYQKGVEWQRSYLLGCIVQLIIEIFLFETLECVWIHFFVPSLVATEVQRVHNFLIDTVNQLCALAPPESRFFLNAPDYLFVSTNVAKCFPDLVESIIVRSFHHHLPGELAKKWHLGTNLRIARINRARRFAPLAAALTMTLTVLQSLATAPFALQRVLIRFVQPFFLAGLVLMWLEIVDNPVYLALFCFFCLVLLVGLITRYYHDRGGGRRISKVRQLDPADVGEEEWKPKPQSATSAVRFDGLQNKNIRLSSDSLYSGEYENEEEEEEDDNDDNSNPDIDDNKNNYNNNNINSLETNDGLSVVKKDDHDKKDVDHNKKDVNNPSDNNNINEIDNNNNSSESSDSNRDLSLPARHPRPGQHSNSDESYDVPYGVSGSESESRSSDTSSTNSGYIEVRVGTAVARDKSL